MEKKDQFTEWLKEKILTNPEEPATNAWDQIAESLDIEETWEGIGEDLELEEVWQKVDSRLHRYTFLQLFERIGYAISGVAAMALLLGLWWGEGAGTEKKDYPLVSANETQTKTPVTIDGQKGTPSATTGIERRNEAFQTVEKTHTQTNPSRSQGGNPHAAEQEREVFKPSLEGKAAGREEKTGFLTGNPDKPLAIQEEQELRFTDDKVGAAENRLSPVNRKAFIHFLAEGSVWPQPPVVDSLAEDINFPEEKANPFTQSQFPAMELGLGSATKLSWLVNDKTLHALEKTSLVTALPGVYTDAFLTYGVRLHPNYMLQADAYLLDWSGQRYQEYRNGSYGTVEDKLLYRSLGLSLKKAGKQLTFTSMPLFSQLNAGLYGGLLSNAREYAAEGITDTRNEYGNFHFGIQAGYGYDLYLSEKLLLNYGVRGRLDLMNIYSGTAAVPGSLRRTRNASLDFVISLKYVLKK